MYDVGFHDEQVLNSLLLVYFHCYTPIQSLPYLWHLLKEVDFYCCIELEKIFCTFSFWELSSSFRTPPIWSLSIWVMNTASNCSILRMVFWYIWYRCLAYHHLLGYDALLHQFLQKREAEHRHWRLLGFGGSFFPLSILYNCYITEKKVILYIKLFFLDLKK